jgi:hypothetical protein
MTQEHPITPPPELVQQWWDGTHGALYEFEAVTTQAARWGADQELEACCEWLQDPDLNVDTYKLRSARRPEPPSLKGKALDELQFSFSRGYLKKEAAETIRRALESLPD